MKAITLRVTDIKRFLSSLLCEHSSRTWVSLSWLSLNLSFYISLILSEKLTSSTADDESSPRKGIAVEAQLTSGKSKSTARSNCGFNLPFSFWFVSSKIVVSMFRIQAFLFCSSTFFFLFVGKLYIVPPFGTGLISSILIFPQALISGIGSMVSVCCIPFRSVWLHLSAPAAQSYQVYVDTKPFISPRADKWYFVAQLAAALASWLSGHTWPNNSMLIGRGRDLGYNRATRRIADQTRTFFLQTCARSHDDNAFWKRNEKRLFLRPILALKKLRVHVAD